MSSSESVKPYFFSSAKYFALCYAKDCGFEGLVVVKLYRSG